MDAFYWLNRKYKDRILDLECQIQDLNNSYHGALTEIDRLKNQINIPLIFDFLESVKNEAVHQQEKWSGNDKNKSDSDWFWLIGYLAGKALFNPGDNKDKQKHRIITVAAAAYNWWISIS